MNPEPGRRHPVHTPLVERWNDPLIVFVTVCSKNRKAIFAKADVHELMKKAWREAKSWMVGRYLIMPDHIHLFCTPNRFPVESIGQWSRYWKNVASKEWPRFAEHPVWQRHFWDTQLRQHESYSEKWRYVIENPVRAGLVPKSKDWPFQGEMNFLPWLAG